MIEEEIRVEADEWKSVVGMGIREDWLESMVAEYVANGGAIQVVPQGASAEVPKFNTVDREHTEVQRRGRMNTIQKGDEKMVAIIEQHLGQCARDELMALLKCSDSKFQRLLNVYFHDDERADPYRAVPHGEYLDRNTERFVKLIQEAQARGVVGRSNVAKAAGIAYNTVNKLVKKGLVDVPKVDRLHRPI
jgi:hypothetical protein